MAMRMNEIDKLKNEISLLKKKLQQKELDIESKRSYGSTEAQHKIRESEQKLRNILEHSTNMFYAHTTDHVLYYVSPQVEKILGYTQEEVMVKWTNLVTDNPINQAGFESTMKAIDTGIAQDPYELELRRKDGEKIFVEVWEAPILEDGKVSGITGSLTDITQRKKAEDALKESVEKFRIAMEATQDGLFDWNLVDNSIYYSPAWKSMLGYAYEEIPNDFSVWEDTIHPEDVKRSWKMQEDLIHKKRERFEIEFKMKHKDGHWVDILSRAKAIFNEKGDAIRIVGTHVDISVRKKWEKELKILNEELSSQNEEYQALNEELEATNKELKKAKEKAEESERLKSAFLANMSHEIRTPMNGILGFTGLLQEPELTGEKQAEFIKIIQQSGDRMLRTVNNIIEISKIETGQSIPILGRVFINDLFRYFYDFFKPETDQKKIKLIYSLGLSDEEAILETDKAMFESVMINLLKNAIKYTHSGEIAFEYSMVHSNSNSHLEFVVRDSGIGIEEDKQELIFQRFRQADIEDRRAYQGSGLGLSIAKAYIELLGGEIRLESVPGQGSQFRFTLPWKPVKNDAKSELADEIEIESDISGKNLNVLIVEDDEASKIHLNILMEPFCKKILNVSSGEEAILMCQNEPDLELVLMDIKLKGMNGYKAVEEIRKFNKKLPIIAQTAYAMMGDRDKAIAAGFSEYISKPIREEELLKLISKI